MTVAELYSRHQVAVGMLRGIPELITPLGKLYIEGYHLSDWIEPRDLAGSFLPIARGQVHIFSTDDGLRTCAELRPLVSRGAIVFHQESLLEVIAWGRERGLLEEAGRYAEVGSACQVSMSGERKCRFDFDLWNRLVRTLTILDDESMRLPEQLSPEQRYLEFREFLRGMTSSPKWSHYARGFAFLREAELELENEVRAQTGRQELRAKCIVLYGQSGVGKTVALAHLAYRFKHGGVPVGYIPRRPLQPDFNDIDLFCETLEASGANRTLIVWDGMCGAEKYGELADYLASRGRKAVIVGSSYRRTGENATTKSVVAWKEMPAVFSKSEAKEFCDFLKSIDQGFDESPEDVYQLANGRFLVALFRILPETRNSIRSGLLREHQAAEGHVQQLDEEGGQPISISARSFGDLLRKAIGARYPELMKKIPVTGDEGPLPAAEQLTGLILVPGRFGLNTPIELVARASGNYGYDQIVRVLKEIDVFMWDEDQMGNITIGPRHPLEAVEVLNARYGSPEFELEFVKQLIFEIKASPFLEDDSSELQFAVNLIRAVGPQGEEPERYGGLIQKLVEIMRQLREERGLVHPTLLFLEGNISREWAKRLQPRPNTERERMEILRRAQEVLEAAIRAVEPTSESRRARSLLTNIHVELAALHGARLLVLTQLENPPLPDITAEYGQVRYHVERSQTYRLVNYYPLDVLFWASRDYLRTGSPSDAERAEILANLVGAFDQAEAEEFESTQEEQYMLRRAELGELLGNHGMRDQALSRLIDQGSLAGVFMMARNMAFGTLGVGLNQPLSREAAAGAIRYLEGNRPGIDRDVRCLGLLLRLKWWLYTGKRMFEEERLTPGLTRDKWNEILGLVNQIIDLEAEKSIPSMLFMKGLVLFHLERFVEAETPFRELDRLFVPGRRRVVAHYLYSDERGQPIRLSGTVRWINQDSTRGSVFCPRIGRVLNFIPQDFRRGEIRPGQALDAFYISFRFRGLLAEDVRFYRRHAEG